LRWRLGGPQNPIAIEIVGAAEEQRYDILYVQDLCVGIVRGDDPRQEAGLLRELLVVGEDRGSREQLHHHAFERPVRLVAWRREECDLGAKSVAVGAEGDAVERAATCGLQRSPTSPGTRITVARGAVTIEDLDSTNGTHVNGTRISAPTRLTPGDEFALGSEVLRIRLRSSSALSVKVDADR
jgi:hypothetical protein